MSSIVHKKKINCLLDKIMSSNEENLSSSSAILFQQISHPINEHSKLTEEQLKKYDTWKTQPGMAQIKLEYV